MSVMGSHEQMIIGGMALMNSQYRSRLDLGELQFALQDANNHQVELANIAAFMKLVQGQFKAKLTLLENEVNKNKEVGHVSLKERCLQIRLKNKEILERTLNLKERLIREMPEQKIYQQRSGHQLNKIMEKIKFKKERVQKKINRMKYLKASQQHKKVSSPKIFQSLPIPMIELKNASEVLSKKSHNLYEELKQLIEILSLQH